MPLVERLLHRTARLASAALCSTVAALRDSRSGAFMAKRQAFQLAKHHTFNRRRVHGPRPTASIRVSLYCCLPITRGRGRHRKACEVDPNSDSDPDSDVADRGVTQSFFLGAPRGRRLGTCGKSSTSIVAHHRQPMPLIERLLHRTATLAFRSAEHVW